MEKIYCADAFILINEFLNKNIKVDHIITDPPYCISKKNNFNTLKNRRGIDFGKWDRDFSLLEWIPKYIKLLNENGSFIIFCSYKFISDICKIFEKNNMIVKDIIIWQKSNPFPRNTNRRYVQDMEFAIWAVKEKSKWIFNKDKNTPYMRSMFNFPIVSGNEKTYHPTQKNLKLMEKIIKIHTNKKQIILDPFMGSGTTGVACKKLNRDFIGIEKNKKYFNVAKKRIEND